MNIKNLSKIDRKNAINLSKRGKMFSLLSNIIIAVITAVVMCLIIRQSPEANLGDSKVFFIITLVFVMIFVFFAIVSSSRNECILKLSMFGVSPNEQELEEHAERLTKKLEKRLEEIENLTKSQVREKQEIQAKLI